MRRRWVGLASQIFGSWTRSSTSPLRAVGGAWGSGQAWTELVLLQRRLSAGESEQWSNSMRMYRDSHGVPRQGGYLGIQMKIPEVWGRRNVCGSARVELLSGNATEARRTRY